MSEKNELLAWAKEELRGVENILYPSFTPDFSALDEEGIRWDVQQTIKHTFCSTFVAPAGCTPEEMRRLVEVIIDEAGGRLHVSLPLGYHGTPEMNKPLIEFAEAAGVSHFMVMHPPSFYPKTKEEIYEVTRRLCDATRLPIVLYPTHKFNFERFHPSRFPLDILDRLVEIDNVVSMKVSILEPGFIYECFSRYSDRILVMCPWERWVPELVHNYGMQWIGAGTYELFQCPEHPYLADYLEMMMQGRRNEAMDIYWKLTPVREVFEKQFIPTVWSGVYNSPMLKYYQWLTGGNGGYIRGSQHLIFQHDMEECKQALRAIGITPREPDEEFYIGRSQYGKQL